MIGIKIMKATLYAQPLGHRLAGFLALEKLEHPLDEAINIPTLFDKMYLSTVSMRVCMHACIIYIYIYVL